MHQYWEWCSLFRTLVKSLPFSSVHFSHLVVSNSLQPHGLQHARLPCPLPTPGACSNSCPSSGWCHPVMSSSVVPFSSRLQSFLASGSFPRSQFFASGGQTIGASASVLLKNISGLISFRIYWFDVLAVQGTLKSLLQHHSSKASILWCSAFFMVQLSHPYITTRKTIALTIQTFVGKVMSLLFNTLSRLWLFFQGASVFEFHGCNHHPQWSWSPRKLSLSLFPFFSNLFVMQWWDRMPWSSFFFLFHLLLLVGG